MAYTDKYIQCAFEIYTRDDRYVGRIQRPGMIGRWLGTGEGIIPGPKTMAIIPVAYRSQVEGWPDKQLLKAIFVSLDAQFRSETGEREEMILLYEPDKSEAQQLALKLGASYLYWSFFDRNRFMHVENLEGEIIKIYYSDDVH